MVNEGNFLGTKNYLELEAYEVTRESMGLKEMKLNRIDFIFLALGAIIFLFFVLDLLGARILFYGDENAASFLLSSFPQSLAALFGITF